MSRNVYSLFITFRIKFCVPKQHLIRKRKIVSRPDKPRFCPYLLQMRNFQKSTDNNSSDRDVVDIYIRTSYFLSYLQRNFALGNLKTTWVMSFAKP